MGTELPLETRLALAIRQIQALAPDVVCLQEVRPIDPTGEGPRLAGKVVGGPAPRDFASLIDGRAGRTAADVITGALGMTAHDAVAVAWADRGIAGIEPSRLGQNQDTPDPRWS